MYDLTKAEAPGARSIALNRSERNYLAVEGILGSVGMNFVIRFDRHLPGGAIKTALRRLISEIPRLRGVVTSRPFSHRLRILDDDAEIDRLLDEAYREVPDVGADLASVERYLGEVINERIDIERGLNLRAHLLLGSDQPVLVLVFHHVLADGRAAVMAIDGFMRLLNGKELSRGTLDPPTMLPALLPDSWRDRYDSLLRSFMSQRAIKKARRAQRVTLLERSSNGRFGATGVRLREVPVSMKEVRHAAAARGCSVGSLLMASLGSAIGKSGARVGGDTALVRVAVDLRRYYPRDRAPTFGNYVATFLVPLRSFESAEALVLEADGGMREGIGLFERKEMSLPLLLQEVSSVLGPKIYGLGAVLGKRLGLVPVNTCHFSNLGDLDALNRHGDRVRIVEMTGSAPNVCPFVATMGIDDKIMLSISYGRNDITEIEADAMIADFARAVVELASTDRHGRPASRGTAEA